MIELPMARKPGEKMKDCVGCGACCRYFQIWVPPPNSVDAACTLLWISYHGATLVVETDEEGDDDWYLFVNTPCNNLTPEMTCKVYLNRPTVCRDYARNACEVNTLGTPQLPPLEGPGAFLRHLRKTRPKVFNQMVGKSYVPPELAEEAKDGA